LESSLHHELLAEVCVVVV